MFKPNENANELYRRMQNLSFECKLDGKQLSTILFGEVLEVQANAKEVSEVCIL
jgi:hypothetical protein